MRMLSGSMHWLTVGLTLLVMAQGWINTANAQVPMKPAASAAMKRVQTGSGGYPVSYGIPPGMSPTDMMQADAPMSMAFPGPAPMDVVYAGANCDVGCDGGPCGGACGGACGGTGACGLLGGGGGLFGGSSGNGGGGGGLLGGSCLGGGASGGQSTICRLLSGYSEGGRASQRWFDFSAGGMALQRTSDVGGFQSSVQNATTGAFTPQDVISTFGVSGTPALRVSDLDFDDLNWGLEVLAALQLGVGSSLEVRYFGLNEWDDGRTVSTIASGNPTLFSTFSDFGTNPGGPNPGFDDTDRSFVHAINYSSAIHNGEVNYRRRWVSANGLFQGSYLGGLRYFDLDEAFRFEAIGSNNNAFTFNQLRFFDTLTVTRNQLTGVQLGGDFWINLTPGLMIGFEGKSGLFGNHAEVESVVTSNSIARASEFLQTGKTAYMVEAAAQAVYRFSYSWSLRGAYNVLYVDNVALAPENFNTRDYSNVLGGANAFTLARAPFINVDSEALYQGFSISAEYLW
ncbi:MAG: hypothetical protein AAF483_15930 [Planctomycetota bacterium]